MDQLFFRTGPGTEVFVIFHETDHIESAVFQRSAGKCRYRDQNFGIPTIISGTDYPGGVFWFAKNPSGSIAVTKDGKYYNRFYFVKPDGSVAQYDKKHLFTYGGEHLRFTPGEERVVVEWKGVRILLEICYDLRFPVWARNRGDYDMILYVASWPTPRVNAWSALLVARAIENQCYVAGVNRVGTDPTCEYCGGSVIIDPYGKTIAACAMGEECEATAEVDMELLEAFRKKFPVLNDADEFERK